MAPSLRYRLLLLDHDDTTVASTETIHYPAHIESIRELRPDLQPCTLEQWFENNLDPGISAYLDSLFSAEQMKVEHEIWTRAMEKQRAMFYEGIPELLAEFRRRGGKVAVISHSQGENIKRDYAAREAPVSAVHQIASSPNKLTHACILWMPCRSEVRFYHARACLWVGVRRGEAKAVAVAGSRCNETARREARTDRHAGRSEAGRGDGYCSGASDSPKHSEQQLNTH